MCYMCYNMCVELGDWRNVSVDFCCLHAPRKYSVILAIQFSYTTGIGIGIIDS